jgi:hypothetical protein
MVLKGFLSRLLSPLERGKPARGLGHSKGVLDS